MKSRSVSTLIALCAAAGLTTVSCAPPAEEPPTGPALTAPEGTMTAQPDIIDVELVDFEIRMRETIPAGPATLRVTNTGRAPHNIEIEGHGVHYHFETHLEPGETRDLMVDLHPGTYRVYCPVADHDARGMAMEITVTQ